MANPRLRSAILLAVAALLALITLFLPWWHVSTTVSSGQFGTMHGGGDVRPFSDGVDGTILTGIFWIVGLLAAIAAVVLLFLPRPLPSWLSPTLGGGAGLLFILMPLLAIITWPGNGSFWGSGSSGNGFGSVSATTYATVGWYFALVCGIVAGIGAFLGLPQDRGTEAPSPQPPQA